MSLIVFDLDGTLIDSQRDLADAANALIAERGGRPLPVDAIAGMVGEGAALLVTRALTAAGVAETEDRALPRFLELYDERLLKTTRLYDGIGEAIDELRADAPLAVLTNKPIRATQRILEGLGVAPKFRWMIGGDGPFARKPDPAGLRHLMVQAHVDSSQTVMVGDSAIDLATARAAGVRICLARYGFGFKFKPGELRGDESFADTPADIVSAVRTIRSST